MFFFAIVEVSIFMIELKLHISIFFSFYNGYLERTQTQLFQRKIDDEGKILHEVCTSDAKVILAKINVAFHVNFHFYQ